jgi:hypothetical protein
VAKADKNPLFGMQAALRSAYYAWWAFVPQFLALCGTAFALLKSLRPH